MKVSDVSQEKVADATEVMKVGDSVESKIINVDRKNRTIGLSVKAKDQDEEKAAIQDLRQREIEQAGPTTIGELIKAQMANQQEDKDD